MAAEHSPRSARSAEMAAPPPEPDLGSLAAPISVRNPSPGYPGPGDKGTEPSRGRLVLIEGDRVDQFVIVQLIGRGGMGEVYLARDTVLERDVALKIVNPDQMVETHAIDRFRVEARATAKLNHPNIVTIHGIGEYHGRPYVALERLTGRTLRDELLRGPRSRDQALEIAGGIADALAYAHEKFVYHRDLTPANVMLCDDGRCRVLDFGLAKIADGDISSVVSITAGSALDAGTPAYMSPEQWRLEKAGAPTDVWAFGVLLFELCTHRRPYQAVEDAPVRGQYERIVAMQQAVGSHDAVPSLGELAALPPELARLIGDCLQKDPAARPGAAAVAERLRAATGPARLAASGGYRGSFLSPSPPAAAVASPAPHAPPAPYAPPSGGLTPPMLRASDAWPMPVAPARRMNVLWLAALLVAAIALALGIILTRGH